MESSYSLRDLKETFVRKVVRASNYDDAAAETKEDIATMHGVEKQHRTENYNFRVGNSVIPASQYGNDFVREFQRILCTYVDRNASQFLEWGAGTTTLILAEFCSNLTKKWLLTIDTVPAYLACVVAAIQDDSFVEARTLSVDGPCLNDRDSGLNYSSYPLATGKKFDFVLIDGRRRMECALIAALVSHRNTVVVLHDYRRARYQSVIALFDIIEDGPQFRVMKLRKTLLPDFGSVFDCVVDRINALGPAAAAERGS